MLDPDFAIIIPLGFVGLVLWFGYEVGVETERDRNARKETEGYRQLAENSKTVLDALAKHVKESGVTMKRVLNAVGSDKCGFAPPRMLAAEELKAEAPRMLDAEEMQNVQAIKAKIRRAMTPYEAGEKPASLHRDAAMAKRKLQPVPPSVPTVKIKRVSRPNGRGK